ncbi:MAG: hypothetical protein E7607_05545 [Ruminococcaceae bacterium]|nr:hypothetical protein [Oscillospiraceae bacterium]
MSKRSFSDIFAFQTPISLAVLIIFLGLLFGSILFNSWILIFALLVSVAFILYDHQIYANEGKSFTRSDIKTIKALIATYGLLSVSLLVSAIRIMITDCFYFAVAAMLVAFIVCASLVVYEITYLRCIALPNCTEPREKMTLRSMLPIAIIAILLVVLNIEIFDTWFRWDSYDYYYYFQNISYTELGQYSNLRPANHAAYGGTLMFLIINGIVGNAAATLYLINILMLVIGAFAIWRITGILFPNWSLWSRTAVTSVLAFSPFLFGLAWSISLETYLAFGLILFFWGRVEKLPVLQVVASLIICFSKETGAVILAAIILSRLIMNFALASNREKSIWEKLDLPVNFPILGFGLFWLGEFLLNSWMGSNAATIATSVDVNFNNFDFSMVYIIGRLKSLIFTNFTWLLFAVILVGFTVGAVNWFKNNRPTVSEEKLYYTVELLVGFFASLIPLFLFVTYNHIRYAAPTVILAILILPLAVDMFALKDKLKTVILGVLAACFIAQSYVTVDPMMHLMFNKISKGNGYLVYTENDVLEKWESVSVSPSVSAQYNREIMYFDEALDHMISQISYDKNTVLLFPDEFRAPTVGGFVSSEYMVFGCGYRYNARVRYISWDSKSNTRFLSSNQDNELIYRTVYTSSSVLNSVDGDKRCVYIQLPFANAEHQEAMLRNFKLTEIGRGKVYGWEIVAYEIERP